jgi:hypothetical protein
VKRAFKYGFYPTDAQAAELSRTFGCVRKVYNLALEARTEAWKSRRERVGYNATSAMLTAWKKTEELAFLSEVSSVPLQQVLRHLQTAFTNFFARIASECDRLWVFRRWTPNRRDGDPAIHALPAPQGSDSLPALKLKGGVSSEDSDDRHVRRVRPRRARGNSGRPLGCAPHLRALAR